MSTPLLVVLHLAQRWGRYGWAAPWTLPGLLLAAVAWLGGARVQRHAGVLEVTGGLFGRLLARLPGPLAFSAMTLGHVILAVDAAALALLRQHEHVHVRQYERWGPLFVPAYLVSSLVQLVLGRNPYRENRFEREAYALASPRPHGFRHVTAGSPAGGHPAGPIRRMMAAWPSLETLETTVDEKPSSSGPDNARHIDLTRETEVHYWCRIFNVNVHELRDAVHHAGHLADEVRRYLQQKAARQAG